MEACAATCGLCAQHAGLSLGAALAARRTGAEASLLRFEARERQLLLTTAQAPQGEPRRAAPLSLCGAIL